MDETLGIDGRHAGWLFAIYYGLVGCGLVVWLAVAARVARREPLLSWAPRSPVPWRVWHVSAAFLWYLLLPSFVLAWLGWKWGVTQQDLLPVPKPELAVWLLAARTTATALAALMIAALLRVDAGATGRDLGLDGRHLARDFAIGLATFVAMAPLVYGIKRLLYPLAPKAHPLETMLRQHPTPALMCWAAVAAVVVAPLVEEFLFRVVLQGWLESLVSRGSDGRGVSFAARSQCGESEDLSTREPAVVDPETGSLAPYIAPADIDSPALDRRSAAAATNVDNRFSRWDLEATLPVLLSSGLFAVFHIGHGLDPIPLFVLALGLGYIYQRTHRLWPGVIVHMALNGLTMVVLGLTLKS